LHACWWEGLCSPAITRLDNKHGTNQDAENLTVKGKSYACTKIVRKVSRAADISEIQSGWNGTSTLWLSPDVPVGGLVKIENRYASQQTPGSKPNMITETWLLTDFGFKNWKP
jgi:hypothetical protein